MKKLCAIIIVIIMLGCSAALVGCSSGKKVDMDMSRFTLTFEDNFDGTELDRSKWNYGFAVDEGKVSAKRKGGFWARDGVSVEDGNLILRTNWREDGENGAGWYSGTVMTSDETSAGDNLFEQKYGYFETRCKTPYFVGGWSAFWLMPFDDFSEEVKDPTSSKHINTATDGAEIDIFETPFSYKLMRNEINHAVHYDGYGELLKTASKTGIRVSKLYDEFHTYGFEWSEKYYKFYVDGRLTWELNSDSYKNKSGKTVKHNIISQVAEYMLLSFEVVAPDNDGSTKGWCGDPSKNDKNKNYDFVIDYVRVYQFK